MDCSRKNSEKNEGGKKGEEEVIKVESESQREVKGC